MWWDGSRSQCLLPSLPEPHFWWSLYPSLYFLRTRAYLILPHVQVQERDDIASGNNNKRSLARKSQRAHPHVQVQERDPDDVFIREETEVIREDVMW